MLLLTTSRQLLASRLIRTGATRSKTRTHPLLTRNASTGSGTPTTSKSDQYKLVIYSKEGCHLCDGLKEKVSAILAKAQFMPSILTGVQLEVRDITTRQDWEQAYSLSIPILTRVDLDGQNEVKITRSPPRISVERLAAHLEEAMKL